MIRLLVTGLTLFQLNMAASNPHGLFLNAWESWLREDLGNAEKHTREAIQEDPRMAEAHYLLARILFRQGHNHAAVNAFRKGQQIRRDNQNRLRALSSASPVDKSSSAGSAVFESMVNTDAARKQFQRGQTALKQGAWQHAAESFFLATRLHPQIAEYREALMRVYVDLGDMVLAEEAADTLLNQNPLQREIYTLFVDEYGEQGKPEQALKWVQRGLTVYPADTYLRDRKLYYDWQSRRLNGRRYE